MGQETEKGTERPNIYLLGNPVKALCNQKV